MKAKDSETCDGAPAAAASPEEDSRATRFCSSCSRTKPVKGGGMVRCANGAKRWKCADCIARSKAHMAAMQPGKAKPSQDPS